jgi:hypothetical protein
VALQELRKLPFLKLAWKGIRKMSNLEHIESFPYNRMSQIKLDGQRNVCSGPTAVNERIEATEVHQIPRQFGTLDIEVSPGQCPGLAKRAAAVETKAAIPLDLMEKQQALDHARLTRAIGPKEQSNRLDRNSLLLPEGFEIPNS